MMIGYIIILLVALLVFLLLWILFTPVFFFIDSNVSRYEIFQYGIFRIRFVPSSMRWQFNIMGFNVQAKEKKPVNKVKPKKKTETKRRGVKKSAHAWFFLIRKGLNSFRLRKLWLDVDTDDVVLNAQLVPVMMMLNRGPVWLQTNYNGRVSLQLVAEGRLNKLLWAFLRFLTKK